MAEPLLRVENLRTHFRTPDGLARAVDGISFSIDRGECLALVGESGCGKSVTALSILGLIDQPPGSIEGSVRFEGRDLLSLRPEELRRIRGNRIAMIFQEPMASLNPVFSAGFQIVEAIREHRRVRRAEAKRQAIELLARVGIPEPERRFDEYPHQLSGGMQQRVMIAMALACRPSLLVADEPTTALDVTIQAQILDLIRDLRRAFEMAVLLITHDLGIVRENAGRVAVMYAGRIVESAPTEDLFRSPRHPYTIRLFRSVPARGKRGQALEAIAGIVPKATAYPPGCRFADRCEPALEMCRRIEPREVEVGEGHAIACHRLDAERGPAAARIPIPAVSAGGDLLDVEGLEVHFPVRRGFLQRTVAHVRAVDGVDLRIRKGEVLALVGESGCGKTTVGKAILRLLDARAGGIRFDGVDLARLPARRVRPFRRWMQFIAQDPYSSLNPRMMVAETIREGMRIHKIARGRRDEVDRVRRLLEQVGLDPDLMYRYPHEFSGGQRQRVGIARALAVEPAFIICDEATSALDVSVQAQILNLLADLRRGLGLTYLFITHNLGVVEYLADRVSVMYLGRIVEEGSAESIFEDPRHPYTRALLSAVPQIDPATGVEKIRLEGDVPSPIRPPEGCHFHPRCPECMDICRRAYPAAARFGEGRWARCHLYE